MVVGTNCNYKAQKARKLNIFVLVLIVYAVIVHPYITHLADDNFFLSKLGHILTVFSVVDSLTVK